MNDELNDFGFTACSSDELEAVTDATSDAKLSNKRADDMHAAIQGLLENLKKNPEKPYIHWPNRVEKIEEFQQKLKNIKGGV